MAPAFASTIRLACGPELTGPGRLCDRTSLASSTQTPQPGGHKLRKMRRIPVQSFSEQVSVVVLRRGAAPRSGPGLRRVLVQEAEPPPRGRDG
jgi:hypothetical protein